MLQLERKQQPGNVSYLPQPELGSVHQLFVVVPSTEADTSMLNRRVWELANSGGFHVRFIGLCGDADSELETRRALITMSSMMNYANVTSDVEVMSASNWVDHLKPRLHQGDMVVYWDSQSMDSLRSPLRQLLTADLNAPLYILPGKSTPSIAGSVSSRQVIAWIGFIAIMLGSLFIQIKIYQLANTWTTTLALLSTAAEFWGIWVWHNWFK